MLLKYLLHKAEQISIPLGINQSKCTRLRFGANECQDCMDICPFNAIKIENDIDIAIEHCKGCMLCTSSCKTEALDSNISLNQFEKFRKETSKLVIGCTREDNIHHFRSSCIGWLSKETLLYLSKSFKEGVKIDVSLCTNCINKESHHYVAAELEKLQSQNLCSNIKLEEEIDALRQNSNSMSRRDFFRSIKTNINTEVKSYATSQEFEKNYFSDSSLPLKRNAILALREKDFANDNLLKKDFSYSIKIGDNCTNCLECTAICPSDALVEDENEQLTFDNFRCSGCNLCAEFCSESAIKISRSIDSEIIADKYLIINNF